jgi:hypothetical protein
MAVKITWFGMRGHHADSCAMLAIWQANLAFGAGSMTGSGTVAITAQ